MTEGSPPAESTPLAETWKPVQQLYKDITSVLARTNPKTELPSGYKATRSFATHGDRGSLVHVQDQLTWAHKKYPVNPKDYAALPGEVKEEILSQPLLTIEIPVAESKWFQIYACDPETLAEDSMYKKVFDPIVGADQDFVRARDEYKIAHPDEPFPAFVVLDGPVPRVLGHQDGHVKSLQSAMLGLVSRTQDL